MKVCSMCANQLPLSRFAIQATGKLGRRADCKECVKRFNRTPEGLVKQSYSQQKAKSKKRGHNPPAYTEGQLFAWYKSQPHAKPMYDRWVSSGFTTELKPSFDRMDDYQPYSLANIRLVTVKENVDRYYQDAIDGVNTKKAVPVDQCNLEGVFLQRHHSYKAAARAVNGLASNIRNVAEALPINRKEPDGSMRSWTPAKAYGFIWRKP